MSVQQLIAYSRPNVVQMMEHIKSTKLSDGKSLAKVCYYGTKASGDNGFCRKASGFFSRKMLYYHPIWQLHAQMEAAMRSSGTNSTGKSLAMKLYNYCISDQRFRMSIWVFQIPNVTAYVDGVATVKRTKEITFKDGQTTEYNGETSSGKLKLHNVTTCGKTSKTVEPRRDHWWNEVLLFISTDTGAGCCRKLVNFWWKEA